MEYLSLAAFFVVGLGLGGILFSSKQSTSDKEWKRLSFEMMKLCERQNTAIEVLRAKLLSAGEVNPEILAESRKILRSLKGKVSKDIKGLKEL